MKPVTAHLSILILVASALLAGHAPAQVLISVDNEDASDDRTGRGMIRPPPAKGASDSIPPPPSTSSELQKLRKNQQADLDRLKNTYDQRARQEVPRRPDGSIDTDSAQYKQLESEYVGKRDGIRDSYTKKDPRMGDFDTKNQIPGVQSTGSKPKDVRADGDWTADTPEAADAKAQQWKDRGNNVVDEGHKIVNKTTDEVLWKPGYGPGDKSLVGDGDAHGTAGGREAVTRKDGQYGKTSGDGPSDKAGTTLDNEKKFLDAKNRGSVKDQAKTVTKAGDTTGRSQDGANADTYTKAKDFKNYGDEISSGVSHLGEDPGTRQSKMNDFQNQLDSEMKQNVAEGARQGQAQDNVRKGIADSAKAAETSGGDKNKAWNDAKNKANFGDTPTTSEAINDRRQQVADSNKATAEANAKTRTEIETGKTKGPDVEGPDGPRGKTGAGADDSVGSLGKAGKALGTGMQIIDIGSTAHDIKEDLKKGDYAGAALKGAEFGADEATMGMYSANKKIWGSASDNYSADRATEHANEMEAEGFNLESAKKLLDKGVPRDEVNRLISEKNKGNEGPLYDAFKDLKVQPPKWTNHEYEKADDTLGERAKAFGEGFVENAKKTGVFVKDTANEAALGAGKLIFGSPDDQQIAKDTMISSLIKDGATPEGAEKAASAFYDKGDKQMLQNLKVVLDKRHGITRDTKDLKDAEGTSEEGAENKTGEEGGKSALDKLTGARDQKNAGTTRDALGTMDANSQMAQGSTAGDQETRDAKNKLNQAGQESQDKQDQTGKQIAAQDKKDSLGTKIGDAVVEGITEGGTAAGTAVGNAAAHKTTAAVFGGKKKSSTGGKGGGNSPDTGTGTSGTTQIAGGKKGQTPGKPVGGKNSGASKSGGKSEKTSSGGTSIASTNPPTSTGTAPVKNCPTCGQPLTPIVVPSDPTNLDGYRWACMECGTKDNRPVSNTTSTATTPVSTPPPPPPPAPAGHTCPGCKGPVTDKDWYMSNYGPAIHCPHCKGAIKVGWSP